MALNEHTRNSLCFATYGAPKRNQNVWLFAHIKCDVLLELDVAYNPAQLRNVCGPQIRKYREMRGWTQVMLATKCQLAGWDVSRDIIATIEGRVRWIGDFELALLADVLEVPVVDLLPARINWAELRAALH